MTRRVLVLDGEPGPWLPEGFVVIPQRGDGLDERLASAFDDAAARRSWSGWTRRRSRRTSSRDRSSALRAPGVDAVLGPATDGGWWAIGLREPDPRVFLGVPMSTPVTGQRQRARLDALAMTVRAPALRDVDVIDDAPAVAAVAPSSRFARTLRGMRRSPAGVPA